jgi:hypothetical protein
MTADNKSASTSSTTSTSSSSSVFINELVAGSFGGVVQVLVGQPFDTGTCVYY